MFEDLRSPAEVLQQRLWYAAKNLDLAGVESALADGAPVDPVIDIYPHGRQSPLHMAVAAHAPFSTGGRAQRLAVIDALIQARAKTPGLPEPAPALAAAFLQGDELVLERLLPLFKRGVDTEMGGLTTGLSNLLMAALTHITKEDSYPGGRLGNLRRLEWVLSKSPALQPGPNGRLTGSMEPMEYALRELSMSPPSSHSRDMLVPAVDMLIAAGCPLAPHPDPSRRQAVAVALARQVILQREWMPYLVSQVPSEQWDGLVAKMDKPEQRAALRELFMEQRLQPAAPAAPPPRARI